MARNGKRNKQIIWQDIVPVKKPPEPTSKIARTLKKIKYSLPSLFKFSNQKKITTISPKQSRKILSKKTKATAIIICFVLVLSICGYYFILMPHNQKTAQTKTKFTVTGLVKGTPEYSTVLPTGKNIKGLGGWTRISPPSSDPVFAYSDKIGDISIIVSQQPLPDNFKTDTTSQIEKLAISFNATEKITVGSTTIYIGASADGPQSVIFNRNNLLILIKSDTKIDNDKWAEYINSLQ